jgi:hypothetical protein
VCGISLSSPTANQTFAVTGGNYNQATLLLEADSSCSGTANWTLNLTYTTANGTAYTASQTTTSTISQSSNYTTNVGQGGQVVAQAPATLAGQSFTQSVTFYVLGTPIPNATITSRLTALYSGATSALLTGIAMTESSYQQFASQSRMGFTGDWPLGNTANQYTTADSYVGPMQVPNNMLDGFDWISDTSDGGSIFQSKLNSASSYSSSEQKTYPSLPALTGVQLENVALVYYDGISGVEFYTPNASGNGWVQTTNSVALTYVSNIRNDIQ